MKKIYKATKDNMVLIGSVSDIARRLNVTRQTVSRAINKGQRVRGYSMKLLKVFNYRAKEWIG